MFLSFSGFFTKVYVVFLVKGHTKNPCDHLFNALKRFKRAQNNETFQDLIVILNKRDDVVATEVMPEDFHGWAKLFKELYSDFPAVVGAPNYESIAALHQQLNAKAASVPSHLGNGALCLLYLTVSPAVYANLSATPFVLPVNPGPTPIIPAAAQGPQIANLRTRFVKATKLFKQYTTTDKALKQLLARAVDKMFIRLLKTKDLGYLNVSTQQILDHLYAQYTCILSAGLQDNDVTFKQPDDPNHGLKNYLIKSRKVLTELPPASPHTPPNKSRTMLFNSCT
jgi:hypothetical protein